jgi:hypothetical protein
VSPLVVSFPVHLQQETEIQKSVISKNKNICWLERWINKLMLGNILKKKAATMICGAFG